MLVLFVDRKKCEVDGKSSFVSINGLAQNRQQTIAWTNDDPVYRSICASPGLSVSFLFIIIIFFVTETQTFIVWQVMLTVE